MIWLILLLSMFLHVWSDFFKQGWLASAKCYSWWLEQKSAIFIDNTGLKHVKPLYQNDYWVMLVAHSIHWAFCVMLPSLIYGIWQTNDLEWFSFVSFAFFVINVVIHSFIDNQKANVFSINLIGDQLLHLIQIMLTVLVLWKMI